MPNARHIHTANPIYSQPVLRSASPTNTITTEYGQDETSLSDRELDDEQFAAKVEMNIGIRQRDEAMPLSGLHILLPKPRNSMEEKVLYEQVMRNLRARVKALEEDELFESTALTNLLASREQQPTSYDIDEIMQSLMGKTLEDRDREPAQTRTQTQTQTQTQEEAPTQGQRDDPRMDTDQPSPTPMTTGQTQAAAAVGTLVGTSAEASGSTVHAHVPPATGRGRGGGTRRTTRRRG